MPLFKDNLLEVDKSTDSPFTPLVSMDSGSLLMSEIVDIPDDSSPSEDSCLMEVGLRNQGGRGNRTDGEASDGVDGEYISFRSPRSQTPESPLAGGPRARRFLRGERSNSCSSPSTATTTHRSGQTHRHGHSDYYVLCFHPQVPRAALSGDANE